MEDLRTTAEDILALLSPAQKRAGAWLLVLMVIGMLMEMLGLGLLLPALGILTDADSAARYPLLQRLSNQTSQAGLVLATMALLCGIYAIKAVYLGYVAWRKARYAYAIQADLSERLFAAYLRQPWSFHLQRNSAQLIRNAYGETSLFTQQGVLPAMMIVSEVLVFAGVAAVLVWVEPLGAAVVVIILGASALLFNRVTRVHVSRWGASRQYHDGRRIQHIQQGLGGAKDVKLLGRESDFLQQFRIHNDASALVGHRWQALQELPRLVLELLGVLGMTVLVAILLVRGRPVEAVLPTIGLFGAAAFKLMPSVNRILGAFQKIRYVRTAMRTLRSEMTLPSESSIEEAGLSGSLTLQETIALENVTFTYQDADSALFTRLNLTIRVGSSIGIVGESGGGKSTLVDLLLGLLEPEAGRVTIDGGDIRGNMRGWQNQIGYVPQFIYLTDDTVRRNVAFGLAAEEIDDEAVRRALRAAQLESFVAELPQALDTVVGERGVRLSGGQRQRIGIARALYHDPAVLVLDEATSSLDTATEEGVMQSVRALKGQKTIVIVAHRLSTVAHCDEVYRLEDGRLQREDTARLAVISGEEDGPE